MPEAENKALVLDWVDALAKGDVERIVAKYHPDLVYTVIGDWPLAGTIGRAYMAANAKDVFKVFPEGLAFRAHKLAADADWVALDMESRGRHVSGKLYNNRYTYWVQIADGKFLRLEEHLDTQHAIEVLCTPSEGGAALDFGARRVEPETDALAVARRFFAAIERGDLPVVRAIYAPDAVIWHNIDRKTKTREENLAMLAFALENVAKLRYEDVRLQPISGGFVEQHVVRGTEKASGRELVLPAVVVCAVDGGCITRLDEYFDSAHAPGSNTET
ncbi:MAG: nuclear transport factor 2 family protein [Myxococcota bacterium]